VAEAARKVACTGATPVAATNCLNFGNPEKPEIMAQFSATIDGIAEACTALGTPITGGNVSFYNETKGEGIYPTPVMGIVGILDDVSKAVPSGFQKPENVVLSFYPYDTTPLTLDERRVSFLRELGVTEFARVCLREFWGQIPALNLTGEAALNTFIAEAAALGLISSASDGGSGGLAVALARSVIANGIGADIDPMIAVADDGGPDPTDALSVFAETGGVIVTCAAEEEDRLVALARRKGLGGLRIGITGGSRLRISAINGFSFIDIGIDDARAAFSSTLESQLAAEVVTA